MHRKTLPRTAVAFSLAAASVLAVSACAPTVDVTAATDAANPACAPMMVALPDKIGDAALRLDFPSGVEGVAEGTDGLPIVESVSVGADRPDLSGVHCGVSGGFLLALRCQAGMKLHVRRGGPFPVVHFLSPFGRCPPKTF